MWYQSQKNVVESFQSKQNPEKATFLKTNSTYYTSKLAEVVRNKITK